MAAGLVRPGGVVILDGGATAPAVVHALPKELACTVITHSPTIAAALLDHPQAEVFVLGGRLFKHSAVTCGAAAFEAAQNVSADLFLLGVTGVRPEAGPTTGDAEDAAMKRALAARAAGTYVLASSEKIGTASRYRFDAFSSGRPAARVEVTSGGEPRHPDVREGVELRVEGLPSGRRGPGAAEARSGAVPVQLLLVRLR